MINGKWKTPYSNCLTAFLLLLLTAIPVNSAMTGAVTTSGAENKAAEFELKDQYDKLEKFQFPNNKVTVLTFGDRKGSGQIESWVRPLWDRYQDRIDQKGIAVLSSVPSFARGLVRRIFRSKVRYPVLLDWKGDVSRAYRYEGGTANLYIIDKNGKIVLKLTGEADQLLLNRVYQQIDRLL